MYPGTVDCSQMLRIAIKKILISIRTSTTAAKMVIFSVNSGFSSHYYGLFAAPDMRPVPAKKDSRMRNDRAKLHELALDPIRS